MTMLSDTEKQQITRIVRHWVVPAIGCTEPICVALAVSRATKELGSTPAHIEAHLSANILKNAMGVGIPGTGMIGLPIAIALGALIGRADKGLECLAAVNSVAVEQAKRYMEAENRIHIDLKDDAPSKLYVEVEVNDENGNHACVAIAGEHTHYIYIARNGQSSLDERGTGKAKPDDGADSVANDMEQLRHNLTLRKVWEYATTMPLEEISFINETRRLNEKAAQLSLEGNYGHCLGKALSRPLGRGIMGDNIFSHILSSTSCACDARMAGAMIPVMSNSGSGNQGICATNPVVVFAEENHNTAEEMTRALMLSHLTAIYIKLNLGTLSALCGCVVASTGSSCGITYLMGGTFEQTSYAVKNMIANLTGMICDGAKPSCTLKLTSGVSTAVLSAMLAMQGNCVNSVEGIIDEDVDQSIRNLVSIGAEAMNETDRRVLDIMTHKQVTPATAQGTQK